MEILAEFLGVALLILLGGSVNANVSLEKTKGHGGGWLVITLGWAVAVMVPVMMFERISGAHFNPAVTVGLAIVGDLEWVSVPAYMGAQLAGGVVGGLLVWLVFRQHFNITKCKDTKLGVFSTAPAIRSWADNFFSEFVGSFVLVFAIIGAITLAPENVGSIGIGSIVLVIGTGLGGTTGYAINPARDLGPRIAYAIAPIKDRRDPDWGYAWIPVIAPLVGGLAAGLIGKVIFL